MKLLKKISQNLISIPGWHTKRKILVIESDDWGSIRMPSIEVYQELIKHGLKVENDPYCRYDNIATVEDLDALFDVLTTVRDKNGRHAVLTANTIVANPDFDKIRQSKFSNYFYEPFTETINRSHIHNNVFKMWEQGINARIFYPQFHGREHLNVNHWMKSLQNGDEITHLAFNLGTFGLTSKVDKRIDMNYMGAYNSGIDKDIELFKVIIEDGLNIFESIFSYRSQSFIPTTYTWNPKIESGLKDKGVYFLQGLVSQRIPIDDNNNFYFKNNNYTGNLSKAGLMYITRNCFFEPSHFRDRYNVVQSAMERIDLAFRWNKPAVMSMHRLNVIGSLNIENRNKNLKLLLILLKKIVEKYPDVEFMTTDELGRLINKNML